MTKRTLLISSIILGTVLTISSAQKPEKSVPTAEEKKKKKPFYLFGSDCDDEGTPIARHGYSAYPGYGRALEDSSKGDGTRKLKRRIQSGGKHNDVNHLEEDDAKRNNNTQQRRNLSKCSKGHKGSKSSKSKGGKSSSSSGYIYEAPADPTNPSSNYTDYIDPNEGDKLDELALEELIRDSCAALDSGNSKPTDMIAIIEYYYEVTVVDDGVKFSEVNESMNTQVSTATGSELIGCNEIQRRELLERKLEKMSGSLIVVGVSPDPDDTVQDAECLVLEQPCAVIRGGMTLYLRHKPGWESDGWRKLESFDDIKSASIAALNDIKKNMNNEAFNDGSDPYGVDGVTETRYISGTTNDGKEVAGNDDVSPDDYTTPPPQADGAKDGTEKVVSEKNAAISPVGIGLVTVGLIAILALATMFLIHKRRSSAESYNEFEDEDDDLADKATDVSSVASRQRAYVIGEEGSIVTSATHDTRFLHAPGNEMGNDNDDANQIDVHHCTSAMCPICNGKETVFVNANDEVDSVETEGYEYEYDGQEVIGKKKRSFEYEAKDDATPPSFDNPAGIERPYVVDNTIDF